MPEVAVTQNEGKTVIVVKGVYSKEENHTAKDVEKYMRGLGSDSIHVEALSKQNGVKSETIQKIDTVIMSMHEGLTQLHNLGFVHGDFAPRNNMMRSDGTVSLIDLGVSRTLNDKGEVEKKAIGALPIYCYDNAAMEQNTNIGVNTDNFSMRLAIIDTLGMYLGLSQDDMVSQVHLNGLPGNQEHQTQNTDRRNFLKEFDDTTRLNNAVTNMDNMIGRLRQANDPRAEVVSPLLEKYRHYIVSFQHEPDLQTAKKNELDSFANAQRPQEMTYDASAPLRETSTSAHNIFAKVLEELKQKQAGENTNLSSKAQSENKSGGNIFDNLRSKMQETMQQKSQGKPDSKPQESALTTPSPRFGK